MFTYIWKDRKQHNQRTQFEIGPLKRPLWSSRYSFRVRIVNLWNSLPDNVVSVNTVNTFKNRLDKFWSDQDLVYDYKSDMTGTGTLLFFSFWTAKLKNSKAPGLCGITAEMLIASGNPGIQWLTRVIKQVWQSGLILSETETETETDMLCRKWTHRHSQNSCKQVFL